MKQNLGEKPHECHLCNASFVKKKALSMHFSREHKDTKAYKCDVCAKSFRKAGHLKRHLIIHTGEKPYKCHICATSFVQSNHLTVHMRSHTLEKPFSCNICGKSFTRTDNLKLHKRTHTGEKPHKCHICDKAFAQLGNLKKHMQFHSEERPYQCNICDKKFKLSQDLKIHVKNHKTKDKLYRKITLTKSTGEWKLKEQDASNDYVKTCTLCQNMISQTGDILSNLDDRCHECRDISSESTTDELQNLAQNLEELESNSQIKSEVVCTNHKPFKCTECGRCFSDARYIKLHSRTHSGRKPYLCLTCMTSYDTIKLLEVHIKNDHPKDKTALLLDSQNNNIVNEAAISGKLMSTSCDNDLFDSNSPFGNLNNVDDDLSSNMLPEDTGSEPWNADELKDVDLMDKKDVFAKDTKDLVHLLGHRDDMFWNYDDM